MRVLVTGVYTPRGRAVCADLVGDGHVVRLFGGNVTDAAAVDRQTRHIDAVVHCDFLPPDIFVSFEGAFEHNFQGSINVAYAARMAGIPLFFRLPGVTEGASSSVVRAQDMAAEVLENEYHAVNLATADLLDELS